MRNKVNLIADISKKLQLIRASKDINGKDVASGVGIPYTTYMGYEDHVSLIPLDKLSQIADWYNIDLDFFVSTGSIFIDNSIAIGSDNNNITIGNNNTTTNNQFDGWATKPATTEQLQLIIKTAAKVAEKKGILITDILSNIFSGYGIDNLREFKKSEIPSVISWLKIQE